MAFGPATAGYDRGITIFSPDGKLYQVEYAAVAVRQGWTIIGIQGGDSAVLISEKRRHAPLIDLRDLEKIFIIDSHIGATFAGLGADGRVLIDYARIVAIRHRFIYDEPIDMESLVRSIGDLKQLFTQQAGVRPFGVSLIFAGVDLRGVHIYKTEPNGLYFRYYATAAGSGEQAVIEYLEKNYKTGMSLEETVITGLKALRSSVETGLEPERVEIGYVTLQEKIFRKLSTEEIADYISKAGVNK